jgi:hypothetical protein
MKRVSKALCAVVAVGIAIAAVTTSSPSVAGDDSLLQVNCAGGSVKVTASSPWHTNKDAPWKWDKGSKVSVDEHAAIFKGDKCEGTIKAFICNGDQCKGPIAVAVSQTGK